MERTGNRKKLYAFLLVLIFLFLVSMPGSGQAAPYFSDDVEGTAQWTAGTPWATTDTASQSATHAWTDSPGGYYAHDTNAALTMTTAIDLSAATSPQLVFWHKHALEGGFDFGFVEISTDGSTWTQLASYTGIAAWKREQIAIPDAFKTSTVKIRFRLLTDKSIVMDGWFIDDVTVAEPANPVPDLTAGAATVSSLGLSWVPNGINDTDFVSYRIYRSTTAGVSTDSTLLTTIIDQATTIYTDANLTPGTTYYYKIYVVNAAGVYAGSKEVSGTTAVGSYNFPFTFDAENGPGAWIATAPWDITTGADRNGQTGKLWHSNPGTTYAKGVNKTLTVKVNLVSAVRPILKFWQKYTLQQNADFGLVEVSIDSGANWSSIYSITAAGSTGVGVAQWEEARIDLTPWAGSGIQLRFRIVDNNDNTQLDGWSIDDVSITENAPGTTPYPFVTGFDPVGTDPQTQNSNFLSNWITTDKGWEFLWTTNEGHAASGAISLLPQSNNHGSVTQARTSHSLVLAKPIDLTGAVNPQFSFWHRFRTQDWYGGYYVYVSMDGGRNWLEKGHWARSNTPDGTQAAWRREQVDLTPYANSKNVLIKFVHYYDDWWGAEYGDAYWYIDDLAVTDGPRDVEFATPTLTVGNTQHSATLTWAVPVNDLFAQYELYRSTTPGITRFNTGMYGAPITVKSTNTYVDPAMEIPGQTYYYRMYTKDTGGLWSPGSNEVAITTDKFLTTVTFPFTDNMESGGTNWSGVYPWIIAEGPDRNGVTGHFWSSNTGASYAKGVNKALTIKVNLVSAIRPILEFWQKYALQQNADFGLMEVSIDSGANWSSIYSITGIGTAGVGSPQWEKARIDLTPWAGSSIQLRFRIVDNNDNTQLDGWSIDDVSITENAPGTTPYPFVTGFDPVGTDPQTQNSNFLSNWITTDKGWEFLWTTNEGHAASGAISLLPQSNNHGSITGARTSHSLVLAKPIDLTGAVNPQFSFWHKFRTADWYGGYYVYVSMNGGRNWLEKGHWARSNTPDGTQAAWRREQIDLTPYANSKNVLIKFVHYYDDWWGAEYGDAYWYIDDVRVGENETIPTNIVKVTGDNQTGRTATALAQPFIVKVIDTNSRSVAGIKVNFAVTEGTGATLSTDSGTSDAVGRVSTLLTLSSVSGANTVTATIDGTTQSVSFTATGFAVGQAMRISKVSGDNQSGVVGNPLAYPLLVKVTDIIGDPVADVSVTFSKIGGDGALTVTDAVLTDANGLASATFTLGAATGVSTISVTSPGLIGSPQAFTAYAVLPGGSLGDTDGDGMPDAWETARGLNPVDPADAALDADNDGLTNLAEYTRGTDPTKADTDGDGMPDKWEVQYGLNPLDPADAARDANGNGKTNLQEYLDQTVPVYQRHFTVARVTNESMVVYGLVSIEGVAAQPGDEVAAICPGNVVCGQFTLETAGQYGFMHIYKDDPLTAEKDGAAPGDLVTFRVWDASAGVELDTTAQVITGTNPPSWTFDGDIGNINLNAGGKQIIPLRAGWNLISFSVKNCYYVGDAVPAEPMLPGINYLRVGSIDQALASIAGKYEVVRSFDSEGAHTFVPSLPEFSNLKYLAAGYGYWIKMTEAANLELTGLKALASDSLAVHTGWNLVGYWANDVRYTGSRPTVSFPPDATAFTPLSSLGEAFSTLAGNYGVVRSFDAGGSHTYDPLLADNFNNLRYVGPGYGIWIRMKTRDDLSY